MDVDIVKFLTEDPELMALHERHHQLTGRYLPGWNMDEYEDLDDYMDQMRQKVKEAEAAHKNENGEKEWRFLTSDPELLSLKKRYTELTGGHLSGYNWDEYRDLDDYMDQMRKKVKEAEAACRS